MLILYAGRLDNNRYENILKMYPNSCIKGLCYNFDELKGNKFNQNNHILFDISNKHPFEDNTVDIYISEQVFEHIEYTKISNILDDIYRILKKNGKLIISLPDYKSNYMFSKINKFNANLLNTEKSKKADWPFQSSLSFNFTIPDIKKNKIIKINKNDNKYESINGESITLDDIKLNTNYKLENNKILVDYLGGLPNKGGHVWFPTIDNVKQLFDNTLFNELIYYHYNDDENKTIINKMPYKFLTRLPETDARFDGQVLCLIMECVK